MVREPWLQPEPFLGGGVCRKGMRVQNNGTLSLHSRNKEVWATHSKHRRDFWKSSKFGWFGYKWQFIYTYKWAPPAGPEPNAVTLITLEANTFRRHESVPNGIGSICTQLFVLGDTGSRDEHEIFQKCRTSKWVCLQREFAEGHGNSDLWDFLLMKLTKDGTGNLRLSYRQTAYMWLSNFTKAFYICIGDGNGWPIVLVLLLGGQLFILVFTLHALMDLKYIAMF